MKKRFLIYLLIIIVVIGICITSCFVIKSKKSNVPEKTTESVTITTITPQTTEETTTQEETTKTSTKKTTSYQTITQTKNQNRSNVYIFIGDSYSDPNKSYGGGWIRNLVTYAGLTDNASNETQAGSSRCLKGKDGKYYRCTQSGAGFCREAGSPAVNFLGLLKELKVDNANAITKIVCCGGWNDKQRNYNDICTNIKEFVKYCNNKYPNAQVYIGFIGWATSENSETQTRVFTYLQNSYKAYKNTNANYIYLKNSEYIMPSSISYFKNGESDYVHTNSSGSLAVGKGIWKCFNGGYNISVSKTKIETFQGSVSVYTSINNGKRTIYIKAKEVMFDYTKYGSSAIIDIIDPDSLYSFNGNEKNVITTKGTVYTDNGTVNCDIKIWIQYKNIYIQPINSNKITSYYGVSIPECSITTGLMDM